MSENFDLDKILGNLGTKKKSDPKPKLSTSDTEFNFDKNLAILDAKIAAKKKTHAQDSPSNHVAKELGDPHFGEVAPHEPKDENKSLSFLKLRDINSFLGRLKIDDSISPRDMIKIYNIDDLTAMVSEENREKLKNAFRIVSEVLKEANSNPDAIVPEDEDIKYKDLLGTDTLSQALFARIINIRLNKK